MFSGWGGGKSQPKDESLGSLAMSAAAPADKGSSGGGGQSIHGFDPTALERAAKAAKDLDKSPNAQKALQSIVVTETTKQKEAEADRAKYQAMQQELAIRRIQEEEQSAARTLEKQTQHDRSRAEYKDQLERKRMVDQINAQRHLAEEERKKAEESLQRQEEIRRKTLEHEAALRQQTEMARVKAEAEGRINQERKNHDLIVEKKKLEAKEYRETILESIKLAGSTVGTGIQEFINDRNQLANTAGVITVMAFGVYTARISTSVAGRYIESRLGKPSLVRDTSRHGVLSMARHPFSTAKKLMAPHKAEDALRDIIQEPALEKRLKRVALSTANTRKNRAPYRHLLLHGPPGTGE
jgi:ATPase family AAA domain-containing protein 3A/B